MTHNHTPDDSRDLPPAPVAPLGAPATVAPRPREVGGPKGLEPTRYGDWERKGRCVDF